MKKLLLLTLVFGAVISCNDYEDDFNNLNDKLNGISTQLDGIETAVQGIADIQLELLNINSAIAAVSDAIGGLPTVADIANLEALINGVSADIAGLDAALATKLTSLESLINNGFSAVDVYLATIDGNLTDAQQSIADVLAELDDIDVELDNIDGDNLQILTQLASMLTAMGDGFDNLSAENQQILLEIGAIQTDLTTTLAQIDALNTLLVALQSTVDTNDASVDAQLDAIKALIEALQDDLTVLLESTTTVYNDDLEILNDAQLEYALSLDDKVMVINGDVEINTNFAGTDPAKLAEINSVMSKMNTVTGNVTIQSTADLLADKLRSIGGDYSVSGFNITDTSLVNVAGDATYNYSTDSYTESNLENIGGSLTITDNGSAIVDFSNLETIGATSVFSIRDSGGVVTNTLTDATTIKLGNAIEDANLSTPGGLIVNYTAAVADDIVVDVLTSMTILGTQAVTGDIDVTCENLTATFADVTATDVSVKSDGLNLTVAAVIADDIIVVDNGANADSSITYTSVEADMFDFSSADAGTLMLTSDQDAASSWTVGETDIMIEGTVTWTHVIQELAGVSCAVALPITGNVDINSTDASVIFDFGWMMGDLSVSAETAATVTSYQSSANDNDFGGNGLADLDGNGSTNWFAVTGDVNVSSSTDAVVFSNKICDDNNIPSYITRGKIYGDVTLSAETSVHLLTRDLYGNTDITAKTDVFIGSGLSNAWLAGSLDVNGFAGTVSFSDSIAISGPVNATGTGTFDGSNWDLSLSTGYQVAGDITISATAGIDLSQANELGDGQSGPYVTTLASDGPINLSAVASTSNDVTISGAGIVDLSALATAAGTLSVEASDTNLDVFVSSTGDVILDTQLNGNALPVLESFESLTVSKETVLQLLEYVSGTIELVDATTFHSSSVATSDLTADNLKDYVLFKQVVDLLITGADLPALLTVDVSTGDTTDLDYNLVNDGIDIISVTGTTVTSITTAGHADVFVVSDNEDLVTLNAGHAKGDNETGSKVHILNNDSLVSYTSNTSSLLELRIEDNASLTTIDLGSYLNGGSADIDFTAADLFGVDYIFTITGNAITGNFAARTATNTPTVLESNELVAEAKAIAEHLLGFRLSDPLLANSVTAKADFMVVNDVVTPVVLTSHPDAEDLYAGTSDGLTGVDFTDGINTPDEWNLLTAE